MLTQGKLKQNNHAKSSPRPLLVTVVSLNGAYQRSQEAAVRKKPKIDGIFV